MSLPESLSFEAFQAMLAELLEVEEAQLTPEAYFVTDLGVDSLRMIQVLLKLEQMGFKVSIGSAWRIQTVSDAYRFYREQVGNG